LIAVISVFQNAKWKGSQLKIQIATPSYLQRLQKEWQTPQHTEKIHLTKKESKKRSTAIHGDNMTPVNDLDPLRMGWKKGKFGRVVCVVNMKQFGNGRVCLL